MSRYTVEEAEKMIKDWLGREVKDRVKELEEPLREVWNDAWAGTTNLIMLNNTDGINEIFSNEKDYRFVVKSACSGNWRESSRYVQLRYSDCKYRLIGYDRIEEFPYFIHDTAHIISNWDKKDVDKLFEVGDKWRYSYTPSRRTTIEEFELEVYKNEEKVSEIKVKLTTWSEDGEEVRCETILEGDHVDKEEGHLVIRSNYDKSPMEILNDFGYKEYDFKRM